MLALESYQRQNIWYGANPSSNTIGFQQEISSHRSPWHNGLVIHLFVFSQVASVENKELTLIATLRWVRGHKAPLCDRPLPSVSIFHTGPGVSWPSRDGFGSLPGVKPIEDWFRFRVQEREREVIYEDILFPLWRLYPAQEKHCTHRCVWKSVS